MVDMVKRPRVSLRKRDVRGARVELSAVSGVAWPEPLVAYVFDDTDA